MPVDVQVATIGEDGRGSGRGRGRKQGEAAHEWFLLKGAGRCPADAGDMAGFSTLQDRQAPRPWPRNGADPWTARLQVSPYW